jgi:branched-chain amino acid transport system substrate-binding protein
MAIHHPLNHTPGRGRRRPFARSGRLTTIAATVGLVALLASACGSSGSSGGGASGGTKPGSPLTVGIVVAESGPLAYLGDYDLAGAQAAAAYFNARGGIDGHRVKLVVQDDQSSPAVALLAARKLVQQDGAQVLMGPEDEGTAPPVVSFANASKIIDIEWGGDWPLSGVSSAASQSYSFPVLPSTSVVGLTMLENDILKPKGYKTVGVILDSESFSQDMKAPLASAAAHDGFSVVASQTIPSGTTDVTAQVLKVLAAKPDVILDWVVPGPNDVTTLKAIRAQSPTIPVMVDGGLDTASFAQAVGASAIQDVDILGSAINHENFLPANSPYRPTINAYLVGMRAQGKYTNPEDMGVAYIGWDSVLMLDQAVTAAKSTSAGAVKAALQHQTMYTPGTYWHRTPSDYGSADELTLAVTYQNGQFINADG